MFNKLKQIADLRKKAKELEKNLAEESVQGEAVQGKIKVTMDGSQNIKEIHIDESLLIPENKEQLENAIKEAFKNAQDGIKKLMIEKVQRGEIQI